MTFWRNKRTWLAAMLAVVFAWGSPAYAGGPKLDNALQHKLKASAGAGGYRVLIETTGHGPADAIIRLAGAKPGRKLVSFPSQAAMVTARQLAWLERHPSVKAIYLDRPTGGAMNRTAVVVGARAVQDQLGYSGAGVGVAVVDSGIASWHDDLTYDGTNSAVRVVGGQRVAGFVDFVNGFTTPYDDHGHGTHVGGIIAGNGHDSRGARAGIAPGAHLVSLKVLDTSGAGYISNVIAAIDWAIANKAAHNIRVMNLSVGAAVTSSYLVDPLTLSAKRAVDAGIVVVSAAGNLGKNAAGEIQYGGITSPANAPWVITVGGYSHHGTLTRADDRMGPYSSRGPTAIDFLSKPDLVAPGTGTVSLAAPNSTLYASKAAYLVAGTIPTADKPYLALTGTSMAAPVVTGTVALMLQANPALTPNAVKAILQYTAQSYPNTDTFSQGAGFLNSKGAVELAKYWQDHPIGSRYPVQKAWSRQVIWGNYRLTGGVIMPNASAWDDNIVWGTAFDATGDNIVWGTTCGDDARCDNIVWGTDIALAADDNIVWGTFAGLDDDNIVWGTFLVDDNIVWGTFADDNIVWGTMCGTANCDNIVWGTSLGAFDDNIVWGTLAGLETDNIVWGTSGGIDNIVWGTSTEQDNATWGCSGEDTPIYEDSADLGDIAFDSLFGAAEPAPAADGGTSPDSAASTTTAGSESDPTTTTSSDAAASSTSTEPLPLPVSGSQLTDGNLLSTGGI